jgi:iron complex transport system ATP-binding protein
MNAPLLQAAGLGVRIGDRRVCDGLHFAVMPGERWALLGLNGVGKTTLLLTLAGLRRAHEGAIRCAGRPLGEWRPQELARLRGLMPQDSVDAFPCTALETVLAGRYPHRCGWLREDEEDLRLAHAALARVGLAGLEARDCATLSGGERRRAALATLLVQQPRLYLLDEPTHHLDPHHQIALLDLLAAECGGDKAAVMSLHDPNLALRYCTHALLLFGEGEAVAGSCAALLDAATLGRLYGHPMRLIAAGDARCFLPA